MNQYSVENSLVPHFQTDKGMCHSLSVNILFHYERENNPFSLAHSDIEKCLWTTGAYMSVCVCLHLNVKRLCTLPLCQNGEMRGIKSETGDEGRHMGWMRRERENKGGNSQMETGECDRAFFHECLLKAPKGRGPRGAGSVKVSLQWHVPSVLMSFNNPGLPCVGLRCPTKTQGWA